MSTNRNLATVPETPVAEIETALSQCSASNLAGMSTVRRFLTLARGMDTLRKHLTGDMLAHVLALANTELGFLTDRPPGAKDKEGKPISYAEWQIRDACIDAMLRGASIIGNEFNVIAGRCYLTRQFFERALREWPGLTELQICEGVPSNAVNAQGALVPMRATWKLHGTQHSIECEHGPDGDYRIPVRINAGMGMDAILGKARRKLLARVFARVSGSAWAMEAVTDDEPESSRAEQLPAEQQGAA